MHRIWVSRYGSSEVLLPKDSSDPIPRNKEVLISVKASGVNFADILIRRGQYPEAPPAPCVVGYEVSGIVEAVGEEATKYKVGDRVFGPTFFGGYTDKITLSEDMLCSIPGALSFSEAAAIPVNYLTAYGLIVESARVNRDDRVLLYSAGGGVGLAALDLLSLIGAKTVGVASPFKHSYLKEKGIHGCLTPEEAKMPDAILNAFQGKKPTVILDSVGGRMSSGNANLLGPLGRIVVFGNSSLLDSENKEMESWPLIDTFDLLQKNISYSGFNLLSVWKNGFAETEKWTEQILKWVSQKKFTPRVDREFPLDNAREAHEYLEARKNIGKVILTC